MIIAHELAFIKNNIWWGLNMWQCWCAKSSSLWKIPNVISEWNTWCIYFRQKWSIQVRNIPIGAAHIYPPHTRPTPPSGCDISHYNLTRISDAISNLSLEQLSVSPKTIWSSLSRFICGELTWSIWRHTSSVMANIRFLSTSFRHSNALGAFLN